MPLEDGEWDEDEGYIEEPTTESANQGTNSPGPGDDQVPPTEPHRVTKDDDTSDSDEPLPEFDSRWRQDFEGLLYLGRLTDTFHWLGHSFLIRTMTTGEILELGLLHQPYVGTYADVKAYQALVVAACVVEVDGKSMPIPISNEKADTELVNRFQYVNRSWFPPTIDAIYERYLILETRVREVMEAMAKAHGWTESMPTLTDTSA